MEDALSYIQAVVNKSHSLVHAQNLVVKYRSKLSDLQTLALSEIIDQYCSYLLGIQQIRGFNEETICEKVRLLNRYYTFLHEKKYENIFTSQSKFRPTILEEFMFLLFQDYIAEIKRMYGDSDDRINSGAAKAYTNLYFSAANMSQFVASPQIKVNEKDQDFAIYRDMCIQVEGKTRIIKLPIVAVENETYVDKTMLDSIIATAEKIKQGNPYALFIVVTETYDVDFNVDPVYSQIDQIYVLRKSKRKDPYQEIDENVVLRLFNDVKEHIERPWSDVEGNLRTRGVIM
ncbi:MAG: Bpu10I family restriction endonuclease [Planctomycetia bacterium]|nr:Bpu10I family restriction endonuclease [Planctomycetia bacterium]